MQQKKSKLSIAMVCFTYPLKEGIVNGGVEAACYYLCRELSAIKDLQITVIRPCATEGTLERMYIGGIEVISLFKPWWMPKPAYLALFAKYQIRRFVKSINPDIVHVQGVSNIAAFLSDMNVVLTIHGIAEIDIQYKGKFRLVRSLIIGTQERLARNSLKNVIAISPFTKEFLRNRNSIKIWDIWNPVPDSFFSVHRSPIRYRIFSATKVTERKNVVNMIRAFASVCRETPEAELRIAGALSDEEYFKACRDIARNEGIEHKVSFLGLLTIQEVSRELSSADIFILFSKHENAPLSIAEAMAAGVPVVASRICGIPYMVSEGVSGRLADPNDFNSMCNALRNALFNDNLESMGMESRRIALENYRADGVARNTAEVYREMSLSAVSVSSM